MKTLAHLDRSTHPPTMSLSVFDAPHRRMHIQAIVRYRQELYEACEEAGIALPIDYPIDLSVIYINPTSPDLGNLYLALEQALDGATLTKRNAVLVDDALVSKLTQRKMYTDPYRLDERGRVRKKSKRHAT